MVQLINPTPVPVTRYSHEKISKLSLLHEADMLWQAEPLLDKKPSVHSEGTL